MATGTLYRPVARDSHGDPVDADGHPVRVGSNGTLVGEIHGLVFGGASWQPTGTRGTVVDTSSLVAVPATEGVQPKHGDTLVIDGVTYSVKGPPRWASRGLVSTPPRYTWWTVTARHN